MAGLKLVTPEQLLSNEQSQAAATVAAEQVANENSRLNTSLIAFIDGEFSRFKRHRDSASGWSDRLTTAMRVFSGVYDITKLQEIRKFGGSEIYARLTAGKSSRSNLTAPRHLPQSGEAVGAETDARPETARRHCRAGSAVGADGGDGRHEGRGRAADHGPDHRAGADADGVGGAGGDQEGETRGRRGVREAG